MNQPTSDFRLPTADLKGRTYWRSLDELADTPEFRRFIENEFPGYAPQMMLAGTRRQFLKIMGASVALAGLVGCRRWPQRKLAPYAARPEGTKPGEPEFYASALERDGVARPILVTAYDGRPVKIEGNPEHPASGGAADLITQAAILNLYDPDRSRHVMKREGDTRSRDTWTHADAALAQIAAAGDANGGAGLVFLAEPTRSPTVLALKQQLLERWGNAKWATYSPLGDRNEIEGAKLAFGRPVRSHVKLDRARVIVSLDDDFLMSRPDSVRLMREFAESRRGVDESNGTMSRLYVAESSYTITGANADERLAIKSSRIGSLARRIAAALEVPGVSSEDSPRLGSHAATVANDLRNAAGNAIMLVGAHQPPEVHALVHAINAKIGAVGKALTYIDAADDETELPDDVQTLIVLGGNPAFDGTKQLAEAVGRASVSVHLGHEDNETAAACTWHLPRAHELEAWGDCRAADGTLSVIQPLIQPLFEGRSVIEVLATLAGEQPDGYQLVRRTFFAEYGVNDKLWRRTLHDGVLPDSAAKPVTPRLDRNLPDVSRASSEGFEIVLRRDYKLADGRYANNGWLQELPDPMTKLAWDNAAYVNTNDAKELGLKHGDMIRITVGSTSLEVPVFPLPGQAAGSIALTVGYGRKIVGHVGRDVGHDVYPLWREAGAAIIASAKVEKTGGHYELITTQDHWAIDSLGASTRDQRVREELIRSVSLQRYRQYPNIIQRDKSHGSHGGVIPLPVVTEEHHDHSHEDHDSSDHQTAESPNHQIPAGFSTGRGPQQFISPLDANAGLSDNQWGMVIDLAACTGCNACVVACQAENNIPIVGKSQVAMNREMHWLRIDRYYVGDPYEPDSVRAVHQPLMCVHCENAPCETVCPVAATTHDSEGLNVMVYNRCIGTRYCSNNCPYKVRRFNYFDWNARDPRRTGDTPPFLGFPDRQQVEQVDPVRQMQFNPEVTVRMRGVMEKCTYCTQRIQAAKQTALVEDRKIRDGEVRTACQQTCPAQAITFGNLKDPDSAVHKLYYDNARGYTLLDDLNVRPRTKYLAKITNPLPQRG